MLIAKGGDKKVDESILKKERKNKGLSQQGMAQKLGIPVASYNQYEQGKRGVPAVVAKKIALILEVDVEKIFLQKSFTVSKS